MKEKITLEREMETLLIPLFGRAEATRQGLCSDPYAAETLDKIEYDFDALKIPKKTRILMALRSRMFDEFVQDFLSRTPGATVLSLGSGLDARYARLDGYSLWVDLDFPEVAALREKLLPVAERHQNIPSSVTESAWLDRIPASNAATLVICEGLTMYLTEADVFSLFKRLSSKFSNLTIAFDAFSRTTVQRANRIHSLHSTGAVIRWGTDDPRELERACGTLRYQQALYFTDHEQITRLSPIYRMAFHVAGQFKVAREAHRILVFTSTN